MCLVRENFWGEMSVLVKSWWLSVTLAEASSMWWGSSFSGLLPDSASHHYPLMSNRESAIAAKKRNHKIFFQRGETTCGWVAGVFCVFVRRCGWNVNPNLAAFGRPCLAPCMPSVQVRQTSHWNFTHSSSWKIDPQSWHPQCNDLFWYKSIRQN